MMSKSGGLNPRAVAGKPSVTKLTHKSWTGIKASGNPKAAVKKIDTTSPVGRKKKLKVNLMHKLATRGQKLGFVYSFYPSDY